MSTPTTHPTDLVLLHGWGMSNGVWDALPSALGSRYRLHPIELPGHGGAGFQPNWHDLPDWADAVLAQAPERAIWLGWSLGGLVALQAALQADALTRERQPENGPGHHGLGHNRAGHRPGRKPGHNPGRIGALILVAATPRFVQSADWRAAMPEATFEQFHGGLIDDPAKTLQRFLALQVRGSDDEREALRRLRAGIAERPSPRSDALRTGLDLLRETDLRNRLADIQLPTLWLFGERDTLVPPAVAERIALLMPGAQCRTIPGAGHAPLLSHGAEAAAAITAFLNGRPE
ncbi:MAG: alpha/beta fold hydrolase [Gammaproteobacteria bacterium]|jgi:pimeloyl-[acyl-carrier protein] methyl ester esterase|nr:alpha/beta fold hydrolase [Gammaproteobacteria bacterium]